VERILQLTKETVRVIDLYNKRLTERTGGEIGEIS
jgi:hypothetical protein